MARKIRFTLALSAVSLSTCDGPRSRPENAPIAGAASPEHSAAIGGSAGGVVMPYPDACADRAAERLRPCGSEPDPCALHSGFAGDEYCLLPPPPGRGLQLHFGPASYSDQAALAPFLVQPGQEFNSYAVVNLPAGQTLRYSYVKVSMRPGSHHLVSSVVAGQLAPGFVKNKTDCGGELLAGFPSTSSPILESPPQGVHAPENQDLAWELPADASLCLDYHRIGETEAAQISEVWINIWFADPAKTSELAHDLVLNAGPMQALPAHAMQLVAATSRVQGAGRMLSLLGHRHAATSRFAVFLNDALIYDSYGWSDPRRFNFDSVTNNPMLAPEAQRDAASSGVLALHSGDLLRVECEMYNASNFEMIFGGDLITQQMCVLLLSATGVSLDPPRATP